METKIFFDLVSLADRAGTPLVDVCDDIRELVKPSEERERVLRNLKAIQRAVQAIPIDMQQIEKKEKVSEFNYEWSMGKKPCKG